MTQRLHTEWTDKYHEGQIVLWAFGWRIRFYAGHTYALDRPWLHKWSAYGHTGIYMRPWHGRCFGIQWRRA